MGINRGIVSADIWSYDHGAVGEGGGEGVDVVPMCV
jgi:hypothetical protein